MSVLALEYLLLVACISHYVQASRNLHLDFLDTLGELWQERETLAEVFADWQHKRAELAELHKQEQDKEQRRDFLKFQLDEIREAAVEEDEDELLAAEKKRLKSADALIKLSQESYSLLSTTLLDGLTRIRKNMEHLVSLDPGAAALAEELSSYSFLAEDHVLHLRHYRDSLENDPVRLEWVSERLNLLQTLKRKYGATLADVLRFAEEAEQELLLLENLEKRGQELEDEVLSLEKKACLLAGELSVKRQKTAREMEEAMGRELASLAFQQSGFAVHRQEIDQIPATLRPTDRSLTIMLRTMPWGSMMNVPR